MRQARAVLAKQMMERRWGQLSFQMQQQQQLNDDEDEGWNNSEEEGRIKITKTDSPVSGWVTLRRQAVDFTPGTYNEMAEFISQFAVSSCWDFNISLSL